MPSSARTCGQRLGSSGGTPRRRERPPRSEESEVNGWKRASRTRRGLTLLVVAAAMALVVGTSLAQLAGSNFESGDGNLVANGGIDWANAPNLAKALDKPTGQSDDSFGNGTKEDTAVPSVIDGSIPNNKSDLTRFYVANEQGGGGDEFLYLAWERVQEPSGTTNMDFEFNKSTQLSGNGVTPVRTAGDVLIKYDLAQGGTNPILGYHLWVTSGNPGTVCEASNTLPCWGKVRSLGGFFEGSINKEIVVDPIAPSAPRTLSVRTFGEAAINLTDSGILPAGTCNGFGRAYLKSRSSDSFTAAVKDFIAPIPVNIANCGRITIKKETDPNGAAGSFGFTTTGGAPLTGFNLSDDGVKVFNDVPAGSYTVTESNPAALGFDLSNLSCTTDTTSGSTTSTNLGARTATITLQAKGEVECTFTNRTRGAISIHKQDDDNPATSLAGAVFSLYHDASPFGGQRGAGDTPVSPATTCTTDAAGNCSMTNLLPGNYWVVETTTPAGYATAADQAVTVAGAQTLPLTFVDPREFTVVVLVCRESDSTLYPSTVTLDGTQTTSMSAADLPAGVTEAEACSLGNGGATKKGRYEDRQHGLHNGSVNIPQ
jgi:hypothetical protein